MVLKITLPQSRLVCRGRIYAAHCWYAKKAGSHICDPYNLSGNLPARQFRFRDRRGGPVCPPVSVMPARLPRRGFGRTRRWQTYMSDPTKPHPLLQLGLTSERAGRFANRPYAILGRLRLPLRGLERKAEHAGRVFVQHRLYLAWFDAVFQHELNEHAQALPGGRVVQLAEIGG